MTKHKYQLLISITLALIGAGCATLMQSVTPARVQAIAKYAAYKYVRGHRAAGQRSAGQLPRCGHTRRWGNGRCEGLGLDRADEGARKGRGPGMIGGVEGQLTIDAGVVLVDMFMGNTITTIGGNDLVRAVAQGALAGHRCRLEPCPRRMARRPRDAAAKPERQAWQARRIQERDVQFRLEAEAMRPKRR